MRHPSVWRPGDFPIGVEVRMENGWDFNYVVYRDGKRIGQFIDYATAAAFAMEQ